MEHEQYYLVVNTIIKISGLPQVSYGIGNFHAGVRRSRRLEKSSGDAGAGACSSVPAAVPLILVFAPLSFPRSFSLGAFFPLVHLL